MAPANPSITQSLQDSRSYGIVVANLVVAISATIAVALRLISRKIQKLQLQADDFLIFLALLFGWAICICDLIAVHNGLGTHIGTLDPSLLAKEGQAFFASELFWAASIPNIKISILLLYIRIFGRLRYFRILAYAIGTFSIIWAIMVVLVLALQCRPVQFIWDKNIDGTCINAPAFFIAGSAPNVFTDFVVLALPWHAVWQLKLSTPQRISLVAIFSLGSLTCIIGLVRLINLIDMFQKANPDMTWLLGPPAIWSTAEPCLGIVSACLPTMRPLVHKILSRRKRGLGEDRFGSKPSDATHKPSFNLHKSTPYNQLDDTFSTKTSFKTQIISEQMDECMQNLKTKNIPTDAIEVETSTSWLNAGPNSSIKHA